LGANSNRPEKRGARPNSADHGLDIDIEIAIDIAVDSDRYTRSL